MFCWSKCLFNLGKFVVEGIFSENLTLLRKIRKKYAKTENSKFFSVHLFPAGVYK